MEMLYAYRFLVAGGQTTALCVSRYVKNSSENHSQRGQLDSNVVM